MSTQSCLDAVERVRGNIPRAEYLHLRNECLKNDDYNEIPPPPIEKNEILELGVLGLGAATVVVGAAAVVGIAAMALVITNQPSTVQTSYARDSLGNVDSQVTTVT